MRTDSSPTATPLSCGRTATAQKATRKKALGMVCLIAKFTEVNAAAIVQQAIARVYGEVRWFQWTESSNLHCGRPRNVFAGAAKRSMDFPASTHRGRSKAARRIQREACQIHLTCLAFIGYCFYGMGKWGDASTKGGIAERLLLRRGSRLMFLQVRSAFLPCGDSAGG